MDEGYYVAIGFLYHPAEGKVLLHHRSDDAPVFPSTWHFFGGGSEDIDDGDPVSTYRREMHEEIGVSLEVGQVNPLYDYQSEWGHRRYVFYSEWPSLAEDFELGEGDGFAWFTLDEALALPDLTPVARHGLELFRAFINDT